MKDATKNKSKFTLTKYHLLGAAVALILCAAASTMLPIWSQTNLSGTVSASSFPAHYKSTISGGLSLIPQYGIKYDVYLKTENILRKSEKPGDPIKETGYGDRSHLQGYGIYRTENYGDYHIWSHSHVNGNRGYLYIISGRNSNDTYSIAFPEVVRKEQDFNSNKYMKDAYFNHPGGLQIIGDYLLVAVQATADNNFGDNGIVYIVDLSSLKRGVAPTTANVKELLGVKGTGTMSVGVTDIKAELGNSVGKKGNYLIALSGDNGSLALYMSNKAGNIWDTAGTYEEVRHFNGDLDYNGIGLFSDTAGDVFMIGFDDRGITGLTPTDYVELYRLTDNKGTTLSTRVNKIEEKHLTTRHTSTVSMNGVHCLWAAGIDVYQDGTLVLFLTERNVGDNGKIEVNYFNQLPIAGDNSQWYNIKASNGQYLYTKDNDANNGTRYVLTSGNLDKNGTKVIFKYEGDSKGRYIYSIRSGKERFKESRFMEVDINPAPNGAKVQIYGWNFGGDNKLWQIVKNSDGTYSFINHRSGMAIDSSNPNDICQRPINGGPTQRFTLVPCGPRV